MSIFRRNKKQSQKNTQARDAGTGKFVSAGTAKKRPKTTVTETKSKKKPVSKKKKTVKQAKPVSKKSKSASKKPKTKVCPDCEGKQLNKFDYSQLCPTCDGKGTVKA